MYASSQVSLPVQFTLAPRDPIIGKHQHWQLSIPFRHAVGFSYNSKIRTNFLRSQLPCDIGACLLLNKYLHTILNRCHEVGGVILRLHDNNCAISCVHREFTLHDPATPSALRHIIRVKSYTRWL
jgi:hypothetical protein